MPKSLLMTAENGSKIARERPVKFYVAAKWQDRPIVHQVYQILKSFGHEITLDWTDHELPNESQMKQSQINNFLSMWAEKDIIGVQNCDLLIALFMEPRHQRGAMVEVGAALGLGKPILIIGHAEDSSTLLRHPLCMHLDDLEDLNKWLKEAPHV